MSRRTAFVQRAISHGLLSSQSPSMAQQTDGFSKTLGLMAREVSNAVCRVVFTMFYDISIVIYIVIIA